MRDLSLAPACTSFRTPPAPGMWVRSKCRELDGRTEHYCGSALAQLETSKSARLLDTHNSDASNTHEKHARGGADNEASMPAGLPEREASTQFSIDPRIAATRTASWGGQCLPEREASRHISIGLRNAALRRASRTSLRASSCRRRAPHRVPWHGASPPRRAPSARLPRQRPRQQLSEPRPAGSATLSEARPEHALLHLSCMQRTPQDASHKPVPPKSAKREHEQPPHAIDAGENWPKAACIQRA